MKALDESGTDESGTTNQGQTKRNPSIVAVLQCGKTAFGVCRFVGVLRFCRGKSIMDVIHKPGD
jgi:hypothetical protein